MSRRRRKPRRFSLQFKVEAVKRILKGESVLALSKELGVLRKDLYVWKQAYKIGGEKLLRPRGRPRGQYAARAREARQTTSELEQATRRIVDLERKVGQQELELDFFVKALRCIEQASQEGGQPSTSSLKRR